MRRSVPFFLVALATTSFAQDPCGSWGVVPIPNPPASANTVVLDVSAHSANDAWAVGRQMVSNVGRTVAWHWDGASWSIVATPSPGQGWAELLTVEVVAADDVWAAGSAVLVAPDGFPGTHILVLHWNGSQWSVVPAPMTVGGSGNFVDDIVAIAPDDIWFVGDWLTFPPTSAAQKRALAMHWNGSGFQIHDTPFFDNAPIGGHGLTAVSAVSSNDVWAVGGGHDGDYVAFSYIVHWDGSQWQYVPGPTAGYYLRMYDVHAVAANDVWAVGDYQDSSGYHGIFIHWDGSSWTRLPDPPVGGTTVHAFASDRVYVGGGGVALWNGASWTTVATFPGVSSPSIQKLEPIGPCSLWGVGRKFEGNALVPLAVRLDPSGGGIGNFCATTPNSAGPGATIGWQGTSSISANDLVLTVSGTTPSTSGLFFYGTTQTSVPFGNGLRCVTGQIRRLAVQQTTNGTATRVFPYANSPVTAGSVWNFQFWFRDVAAGGAGFDTSNGLEVHFTP